MVTYHRFEDLPVWQAAVALYERVDDILQNDIPGLRFSFRDQLERAVLSISNNIAEGFERGTTRELLAFIYIARGSAGEVRSMLSILKRRPWTSNRKSEIASLIELAEGCSRQLHAWADALQNSEITGQRGLNEKSRRDYNRNQQCRNAEAELQAIREQYLPPDHPLRQK